MRRSNIKLFRFIIFVIFNRDYAYSVEEVTFITYNIIHV